MNKTEEQVSIVSQSPIEASAAPEATTPAGTLVLKLQELGDLVAEVAKHKRSLSKREKAEIDAIEKDMQERIETLLIGCRVAEAEVKLESMRKIMEIIKAPKGK